MLQECARIKLLECNQLNICGALISIR